jgi:hypothetical protein
MSWKGLVAVLSPHAMCPSLSQSLSESVSKPQIGGVPFDSDSDSDSDSDISVGGPWTLRPAPQAPALPNGEAQRLQLLAGEIRFAGARMLEDHVLEVDHALPLVTHLEVD